MNLSPIAGWGRFGTIRNTAAFPFAPRFRRKSYAPGWTGEGEKILDDLLDEQCSEHCVELQVMFQSALSLCRELSQILSRP